VSIADVLHINSSRNLSARDCVLLLLACAKECMVKFPLGVSSSALKRTMHSGLDPGANVPIFLKKVVTTNLRTSFTPISILPMIHVRGLRILPSPAASASSSPDSGISALLGLASSAAALLGLASSAAALLGPVSLLSAAALLGPAASAAALAAAAAAAAALAASIMSVPDIVGAAGEGRERGWSG
jgi:hypothetical protein